MNRKEIFDSDRLVSPDATPEWNSRAAEAMPTGEIESEPDATV